MIKNLTFDVGFFYFVHVADMRIRMILSRLSSIVILYYAVMIFSAYQKIRNLGGRIVIKKKLDFGYKMSIVCSGSKMIGAVVVFRV